MDSIVQVLVDKLCAAKLDINAAGELMKLCCSSLERVNQSKISIATKHKLCKALATSFFLLIESDSDNFPETLSYIRISLTCMSHLKKSSVSSHILCRALLERSSEYSHLFNPNFKPNSVNVGDNISLLNENLKFTLGNRFRKLPNATITKSNTPVTNVNKDVVKMNRTSTPSRESINSYLLVEAFKSSINNIEDFASLFVEFVCPMMFDKHSWPSDETLRIINERNISILRKFEQIPPLWDLYQLIGQNGCLNSCLVLVKALLAAHIALWASATTNMSQDKMISTAKLIPPLAQSKLVPKAFGLTVQVFPHLAPNEVFAVLSDIWQFLKDSSSVDAPKIDPGIYLNRLRLFMCQHTPGPLYVKIFKELRQELAADNQPQTPPIAAPEEAAAATLHKQQSGCSKKLKCS